MPKTKAEAIAEWMTAYMRGNELNTLITNLWDTAYREGENTGYTEGYRDSLDDSKKLIRQGKNIG